MEETYTIEPKMVQFLYRELSATEAVEMAHFIEEDANAGALYAKLFAAKAQLPKVLFSPSPNTLNNILQYSAKTALEAHF